MKKTFSLFFILWVVYFFNQTPYFMIQPIGNGADDQQNIQNALNGNKFVSLAPNSTYTIKSNIILKNFMDSNNYPQDGNTLYIPSTTVLKYDGPNWAAIEMKGNANLLGDGTLMFQEGLTPWGSGKAAIKVTSANNRIDFGYIRGFEHGIALIGDNYDGNDTAINQGLSGCGWNNIHVKSIADTRISVYLNPKGVSSWVNQNYVKVDRLFFNSGKNGNTTIGTTSNGDSINVKTGAHGIYMDPTSKSYPNSNTFSMAIEGVELGVLLFGINNRFEGLRLEHCKNSFYILGSETKSNYIFGEFGNFSNNPTANMINGTSKDIDELLQIYGWGNENKIRNLYVSGNAVFKSPIVVGSDEKLKSNVKPIENAKDVVIRMNGATYNYKFKNDNKRYYGFIAQELKKVVPELVFNNNSSNEDTYYINYDGVIPILVEAFKEQNNKILELENQLELLKVSNNLNNNSSPILFQNSPNPSSTETSIEYYLPKKYSNVYIILKNLMGNELKKIKVDNNKGRNKILVNLNGINSGVFLYSLLADDLLIDSKKMIIK